MLSQYVGMYINKVIERLESEYSLKKEELQKLFDECMENEAKEKPKEKSKEPIKKETKEKTTNSCEYMYLRGTKMGTTCTSKKKNDQFCAKHIPKDKEKKEKEPEKEKEYRMKSVPQVKEDVEVNNKILKKNKIIDKWWHEKTKLVFKSDVDKIVFATYKNNALEDLTDKDIELCQQYGFKYEIPVREPKQKKQKIDNFNETSKDVEYHIKNMIKKDEEDEEEEDEEEVVEEEEVVMDIKDEDEEDEVEEEEEEEEEEEMDEEE